LGQPPPALRVNALPSALKQPQPKGFNDCHAFATGFHFNGLHDFKHGIHAGAVHNAPIRAHHTRVFIRARILGQVFKYAAVVKIAQINFARVEKIIGHGRLAPTVQRWVVKLAHAQTQRHEGCK